jgi:DNA-binding NarL/FixJ family response regulator
MPPVDGIVATSRLRGRPRPPEVIVPTTFDTDENVLLTLRAGASGFLLEGSPHAQIADALRRVAPGDPILSPAVTRRLRDRAATEAGAHQRARARLAALNEREHCVVLAVAQGRTPMRGSPPPVHERGDSEGPRPSHPGQACANEPNPDRPLLAHDAGLS